MENRSQFITVPGSIIIAATIIAIAVVYVFHPSGSTVNTTQNTPKIPIVTMAPITSSDHIFGNPNASIKIVEYSDPSCPYCKIFNPTMEQIMNTYGASGQVVWIYRQFPLDKPDTNGNILHPNAGHEAQAFECAASIGGNDKFWAFEKEWYNVFPLQGATGRSVAEDTAQLADIAKTIGLNAQSFSDCLGSGQMKDKVEAEYTDGINAGVSGTPYNVIITPSGNRIPLAGAASYATLKTTIDTLLNSGVNQ